jgi:hypothetical protein
MGKIAIDFTTFEIVERDFPEACKFCFEEDCNDCPFVEEKLELETELLLAAEPTLDKYELL